MYTLLNQNCKLLDFDMKETVYGNQYTIRNIYKENLNQLPSYISGNGLSNETLGEWLSLRVAPTGRHHLEKVLNAINLENKFYVLMYSHALSLNDTYWIKEDNENINFEEINLYDNPFDKTLGWIAFTGIDSKVSKTLGTPETTTGGMLAKYWERDENNNIRLVKGGTKNYANAGGEPFSEAAASIIADVININHIPYKLEYKKYNNEILPVSTSYLFTNKEYGLKTANEYLIEKFPHRNKIDLPTLLNELKNEAFNIKPFYEMCFFDWLIKNEDRHLNNWGFMVNNKTQKISHMAPLWDNGASLLYSSMQSDFALGVEEADAYTRTTYFSSFNIPYNFIFECEYRKELIHKCNTLLKAINDGSLSKSLDEAYPDTDWAKKHSWKKEYILSLLKDNCIYFLDEYRHMDYKAYLNSRKGDIYNFNNILDAAAKAADELNKTLEKREKRFSHKIKKDIGI
ncbi:MAG: HipA domain-containing protein [Clostridia bacterium]|nr:HipA domain-containing protein [Clostridia bacterium]